MASQVWSLLCYTLLSVFLGVKAMQFEIVRSPGNFYCARLSCVNEVNQEAYSFSNNRMCIYDVNEKGIRTKLAYISLTEPDLHIEGTRVSVVNGTGHFSKTNVDILLDFRSDADCLRGTYICELEFLGVKGKKEVLSETVTPGEQSGECSCSSITEQFAKLVTRSNEIDRSIFIQRQVNGDLSNEIRNLRQDVSEKRSTVDKLTQDSTLMAETNNALRQSDKDIQEEIAAQSRSDTLLAEEIASLNSNDVKQEQALAEEKAQDEANNEAIGKLRQDDRAAESAISERRRYDAKFSEYVNQLENNDESLEDQIDDVRRAHNGLQVEINTLRQSDENQAGEVRARQSTHEAQSRAVSELRTNFDAQVSQIVVLKEVDANFRATLNGVQQNNTAFDATILDLRRKTQQHEQDLAALRHKDELADNQITLLSATDVTIVQEIAALQRVDTVIQQQIDELTVTDSDITGEISGLQDKDAALRVQITQLRNTDQVLQTRIFNQSQRYESLQQQVLALTQKNVILLSRLAELQQQIVLFQHYIKASQVTTVVRTTTRLSQVQCTRGMVHTQTRERVVVNGITVMCDTETDNGGWLIVESRADDDEDFDRTWDDYKNGFGKITGNYWAGLETIYKFISMGFTELRVDLVLDGKSYYAHYDVFGVGSEQANYKLSVSGYSGDAGDSLSYHNGFGFSTKDKDNDGDKRNCAQISGGGWWYNSCYRANLNGRMDKSGDDGVIWKSLSESKCLSFVEIKIRRPDSYSEYVPVDPVPEY